MRKRLSPREVECLSFLAQGLSNDEVALMLGISIKTVKVHMRHLYEKLDVVRRARPASAAVYRGIFDGWISDGL